VKTVLIALVAASAAYLLFAGDGGDVSGSQARNLVQHGAFLLDVRTPAEFADGHIDGAVNIPVQQLAQRMDELPGEQHPIVLYCRSGKRSGTAARMLRRNGYRNLHDLGAMTAW
jgi:phage shock protein E